MSLEEYSNIISPYLRDMIDNYMAHNEWEIQLIMKIDFIFSLDINDTCIMHTKIDNIEIMKGTETSDVINEFFKSFFRRYQKGLKTKMKGNSYLLESVDLLHYILHKISLNRGGSYINSSDWIKNKKATINPKNKDNECFKYAITAALNYCEIDTYSEKISALKPFSNYNWKDIDIPSYSQDWKKFERNNKTIALNILFVPYNTNQIRPAYISKCNHKCDNKVNLLTITDNNNWHYLSIKNVPKLLRRITSNHNGYFYCLNCFHSSTTEKKL